jgi:putative ABC transport system permease protein
MARHFWPNESAIGKRVGDRQGKDVIWREVIGVVDDISPAMELTAPNTMFQVYKPLAHEPWGYLWLMVRGDHPAGFKNDVRRAVSDIDPDVAVQELVTVPEAADRYMHNIVVVNHTVAGFALLGLLLAAIGLYGVISNLVAQRWGEFGIRLALGAGPRDVLWLVLHTGLFLTLLGLGAGTILAGVLNWALRMAMPRLTGTDPLAIALVAVALLLVSLLACWLPARRATRVNPLEALRAE